MDAGALRRVRASLSASLVVAATGNGRLAPELAAGIARGKSEKSHRRQVQQVATLRQALALLNAPDITTMKGLRDRTVIACLLGCALRRCEVAALADGRSLGAFTVEATVA